MGVEEAFETAAGFLGALAMIPVAVLIMGGATNFTNPEFDFVQWFEAVVYALIQASIPAFGAIIVLGLLILLLRFAE